MKWTHAQFVAALVAGLVGSFAGSAAAQTGSSSSEYSVITESAPQARLVTSGVLTSIERDINQTIAVGQFGSVIRYEDNNWQQAEVPTSVFLTSVSYGDDSQHVWAAGHEGVIIRSVDGGQSWERIFDGYQLLEMEYPYLLQQQAMMEDAMAEAEAADDMDAYDELEFLLFELQFQIQAAEVQQDVGPTKPFLDIHFVNNQHGFALGAYNTLLETRDGGDSWEYVSYRVENPSGFHLNQMISNTDGDLFIIGETGLLFRSDDQGASFELLDSPYNGSLFGGVFDNDGKLWVYGLRGNLFVSDDNGDTFSAVPTPTRYNLNAGTVLANGDLVVVGHSGTILLVDTASFEVTAFEHASSSILTGVLQHLGNELWLVGRSGIQQFMLPSTLTEAGE